MPKNKNYNKEKNKGKRQNIIVDREKYRSNVKSLSFTTTVSLPSPPYSWFDDIMDGDENIEKHYKSLLKSQGYKIYDRSDADWSYEETDFIIYMPENKGYVRLTYSGCSECPISKDHNSGTECYCGRKYPRTWKGKKEHCYQLFIDNIKGIKYMISETRPYTGLELIKYELANNHMFYNKSHENPYKQLNSMEEELKWMDECEKDSTSPDTIMNKLGKHYSDIQVIDLEKILK